MINIISIYLPCSFFLLSFLLCLISSVNLFVMHIVVWLIYQALPYIKEKNLYGDFFSVLPFSFDNFLKVCLLFNLLLWENFSFFKVDEAACLHFDSLTLSWHQRYSSSINVNYKKLTWKFMKEGELGGLVWLMDCLGKYEPRIVTIYHIDYTCYIIWVLSFEFSSLFKHKLSI